MDAYPGAKAFIKHLEETTDFEYRTGKPKVDPRFAKFMPGGAQTTSDFKPRKPKLSVSTTIPPKEAEEAQREDSKASPSPGKGSSDGSPTIESPRSKITGFKARDSTQYQEKGIKRFAVGDSYEQAS